MFVFQGVFVADGKCVNTHAARNFHGLKNVLHVRLALFPWTRKARCTCGMLFGLNFHFFFYPTVGGHLSDLSIVSFLFPSSIRTAEFCLPLAHLDEALGDLIEISIHYKEKFGQFSLLPIYVRLVKTDDLYLSPANRKCPADGSDFGDACYVEVSIS